MSPFLFPPILVYLLKMTLVSTCLYGYYWFFLRNAAFHVYNRCYLLASIAIALLLPLIHLPAAWSEAAHFIIPAKSGPPLPALPGSSPAASPMEAPDWSLPSLLYAGIAAVFLLRLLPPLNHIVRLTRRYPCTRLEGIRFYETAEPGTPFSFARSLFWDRRIPLGSQAGQAILRHEMTHIRQHHTLDILFLEGVRCLLWINPFFHQRSSGASPGPATPPVSPIPSFIHT